MNLPPRLKFDLNIELDKWACNSSMFYNSNIKDYPGLAKGKDLGSEAKTAYNNKFVDDFYTAHINEIKNAIKIMKRDWLRNEKKYFEATGRLFSNPWPKGRYTCHLSIFNRNPRFIETKEFQAFYKHSATTNFVCAHEMLHFIFYDYVEKNFTEKPRNMEEKTIWKLSEIFNDVILRLPEFVAITGQKEPAFYAESEQELNDAIKLWEEVKTVKVFIAKYFKLVGYSESPLSYSR